MEITAPTITLANRRRVRFRALRYLITFLAPAWGIVGLLGHGWWTWALPLHAFFLVPLLEALLTHPPDNLNDEEERAALADPLFDALLYVLVPLQWGILILFLFQVGEAGLSAWEIAGRVASMGILCGIYGINVAHELGHRAKRWERDLGRALLLTSLYMHFIIEHNRGHHRRVATPDDPASARYGEWLYAFWFRSIVFGFVSAWRIEAERLRKEGHAPYGLRNEMLHALVWQVALLAGIAWVFGPFTVLAFVAAALIGILLLETVNYIEHYGLRRTRDEKGHYRRVQHVHSWNSDHRLGRLTLFELTRHSDHHWKASRPYHVLRSVDRAPQLPTGYPGMMLMSLLPPVFFAVMHPRIKALAAMDPDLRLAMEDKDLVLGEATPSTP
ncbi:MAG: alkane 1-monooxygenase [Flavobacteriales bacterium]|nr:alkane 1-monooxygenase [Flavobacteriales bacterium]